MKKREDENDFSEKYYELTMSEDYSPKSHD